MFPIFYLLVESKRKRNLSPKDFGCVSCGNMKRRCDVAVFMKKDYNLQSELVQKVLLKYNEENYNNVIYVCCSCWYNLKGLSRDGEKNEMKNTSNQTCCDMGQNDTIGKIELIPGFVFSR